MVDNKVVENGPTAPSELSCHIVKLSVELFAIIATHLKLEDIQSARLSGRELNFFLGPYLFRSIKFAPQKESLDIIDAVFRDGSLSHNTKVLRFDTTICRIPTALDDLDISEFNLWGRLAARPIDGPLLFPSDTPSEFQPALDIYTKHIKEQESIYMNLEDHLFGLFEKFPKLSAIVLCNTLMKNPPSEIKPALQKRSISRKWIRPHQLWALFRAISRSAECKITKIDVEGHWTLEKYRDNRDFGDDSRIPGSIKYCFPDFKAARYWEENIPFILSSAFELSAKDLSITRTVFSNLTHLNLGIFSTLTLRKRYHDEIEDKDNPKKYWADLPKVLHSLTNVTSLSLDLKICRQIDQQHVYSYYHDDFEELFENPPLILPRLKSLRIAHFRSSAKSISLLLRRHPAIENLTLRHAILICNPNYDLYHNPFGNLLYQNSQYSWSQVIEDMRALHLKRLDLYGIEGFGSSYNRFGSDNETHRLSRILNYVLYDYGRNPLVPRRDSDELDVTWLDDCDWVYWDAELW